MILSAGLSPAWQQILTFEAFTPGEVNRAVRVEGCASGKVLNVGRAVRALGAAGHTVCSVGGPLAEAIRSEFASEDIPATWIATASATRVCTTIVDQSVNPPIATELVENAGPVTEGEVEEFFACCRQLASGASLQVLAGSLPPLPGGGQPVDLYRRLLQEGPPGILDVRGPELQKALPQRPLLVKPNREELSRTVGRPLSDERAVITAMHELNGLGAQWVLITAGAEDALLSDGHKVWRFTPPVCDVVNPIGCGDCLAAGVAVALEDGAEMVDAVRFGIAASVENLRQLLPARLSLACVDATVDDVSVHVV